MKAQLLINILDNKFVTRNRKPLRQKGEDPEGRDPKAWQLYDKKGELSFFSWLGYTDLF